MRIRFEETDENLVIDLQLMLLMPSFQKRFSQYISKELLTIAYPTLITLSRIAYS